MRKLVLFLFPFTIGVCACAQPVSSIKSNRSMQDRQTGKLNVIFFLVDDLGWTDIGCNGSTLYETPNIDRLAGEGIFFRQAYAACPVCSPTRASILTGKYPARIDLTDWLPGRKEFSFQMLKNAAINKHLPFEENTLTEVLKENGYRTALIGKWHLGEDPSSPLQHGFDQRLPEWNKGGPPTYYSPYRLKGLEAAEGEYLTDRLTDEALRYIEENKQSPFFLYFAHFSVHDPIEGRRDLVQKYEKKLERMPLREGVPYILEGNPDASKPFSREELNKQLTDDAFAGFGPLPYQIVKVKQRQDNAEFAAMVETVDESLGRILSKLSQLGLTDETIVIFFSDNGGMSAANLIPGGPDNLKEIPKTALTKRYSTSNLPLRGGKGWLYEGGIRVPMIIKWSGITTNRTIDTPVISTDFYPTILEMLGLPLQPQQHLDGMSLVPLLEGKQTSQRTPLYWHFPHYSNHGQQSPGGAILHGNYKLIEYYERNTVQLFNLKTDLGEEHDLAAVEPAKAAELKSMLHAWRMEVSANMMPPNPDYVAGQR